jgi:hypothetical protein
MIRVDKDENVSSPGRPETNETSGKFALMRCSKLPKRPDAPGTEQDELEWMTPTFVPMTAEQRERVVHLQAQMLKPYLERLAAERDRLRPAV